MAELIGILSFGSLLFLGGVCNIIQIGDNAQEYLVAVELINLLVSFIACPLQLSQPALIMLGTILNSWPQECRSQNLPRLCR